MTAIIQNSPIYNLPNLYKNGLNISKTSDTLLLIGSGSCRDQNNVIDIEIGSQNIESELQSSTLTLDFTKVGVNGLASSTPVQTATMYAIYLIADSRYYLPTASLAVSVGDNLVSVPFGYDSMRLIGYWMTKVDSSALEDGFYSGSGNNISFNYYDGRIVLTNGNETAFTPIDLGSVVPPIDGIIINTIQFMVVQSVGDFFATTGLNMGVLRTPGYLIGQVSGAISGNVLLPAQINGMTQHPSIKYAVNDSSVTGTINLLSFYLSL